MRRTQQALIQVRGVMQSRGPVHRGANIYSRTAIIWAILFLVSGCAYTAGYNPTYLPDEEPDYLSADEVLLVMPDEDEGFVFSGSPTSLTGGATKLTIPLGTILKEVSEEILEDRFSGGVDFANEFVSGKGYRIALQPSIKRFEYKYNSLKNIGLAVTPQIEVDLQVKILDESGQSIFDHLYESGRVSGDTYFVSGSPDEKVNETLHRTLYDLLEQSFADARPVVIERLGE